MRLFIAIDLPDKAKDQIDKLTKTLAKQSADVRWEKRENFHLTLKFLGQVVTRTIPQINEVVSAITVKYPSFPLTFRGVHAFRSRRYIIYLQVKDNTILRQLAESLNSAVETVGVSRDKRAFSAHITLGKKPISDQDNGDIEEMNVPVLEPMQVTEIVLMKSILTPQGSIYSILNRYPLKA